MSWGLEARLKYPNEVGCRVLHGGDNAANVAAYIKGRSASRRLDRRCRRAAAIQIGGKLMGFLFWVATDKNPADRPSRVHSTEKHNPWSEPRQPPARTTTAPGLPKFWATRERLFVHLCSGPRCEGDVCDWVERLALERGLVIKAVPYDPIIDSSMDLSSGSEFLRWRAKCKSDDVCRILASPPCSTFSRARHNPLPGGGGPRPLRGRDRVWEPLPGLIPRELKAVVLGTLLVVSCLGLLARLGGRKYWRMLEHPADPGRHPYPSVFATDLMREVRSFIDGQVVTLRQCRFGAPPVKPTMLLSNGLGLRRTGLLCNHHGKHQVLAGRNASGGFRTTVAAAYPSPLCRFVAESAVAHISHRQSHAPPEDGMSAWDNRGASELLHAFGTAWRECRQVPLGGERLQV